MQNVPFCYDAITANWHVADGTKGNSISGDYVLLDGREGNLCSGPMPLPGDGAATGSLTGMMVTGTGGSTSVSMTATATTATGEGTGAVTGGRTGAGVDGGTQSDATTTAAAGSSGSARPMTDGLLMELLVVCGGVVIGTGLLFSACRSAIWTRLDVCTVTTWKPAGAGFSNVIFTSQSRRGGQQYCVGMRRCWTSQASEVMFSVRSDDIYLTYLFRQAFIHLLQPSALAFL